MGIMSFCATITTQMLAVESIVFKQLQIIYVNNRGEKQSKALWFHDVLLVVLYWNY